MPRKPEPKLWDAKRVAEELGISRKTVLNRGAGTGALPPHRFGSRVLFDPADVKELKRQRREQGIKQVEKARRVPIVGTDERRAG